MRTNKETILLAEIRRLIRLANKAYKKDNGMPYFYNNEKYKYSRRIKGTEKSIEGHYYVKSDKIIEELANKIFQLIKNHNK